MEAQQKSTVAAVVGDFRPLAGFVVSLMAGVLILVGGVSMLGYSSGPYSGMMGGFGGGTMSGYYGMMQGFGGWFYGFAVLGIAAGILVLFAAMMMYDRPREAAMWGALVLGFSVVSFFGAGGFFIGAVLGILGGILALTWKEGRPTSDKRSREVSAEQDSATSNPSNLLEQIRLFSKKIMAVRPGMSFPRIP